MDIRSVCTSDSPGSIPGGGGHVQLRTPVDFSNFDEIIEVVLHHEGGYVNDPKDPGGETNFGVAKRSHPDVDIANLTKDGAKEIYKEYYWDANKVESLLNCLAFN